MSVRASHPAKAISSTYVTDAGILSTVSSSQKANAPKPISTTGWPPIDDGIVTSPEASSTAVIATPESRDSVSQPTARAPSAITAANPITSIFFIVSPLNLKSCL